jgi:hypothetical protein
LDPTPTVVALSLLVGASVGVTHGIAHNVAGEESLFDAAGVNAAGISVTLAAATASYVILSLAGVAA